MLPTPVNILFVSRRNTLRSVIAEACLAKLGVGRIRAFSCGAPKQIGQHPEPAAIDALKKAGLPATAMSCRDWTSFTRHAAPRMNYVITLAQEIAGDTPTWPGQPVTAIWPFDDVLEAGETPEALERAIWITLLSLRRRIELLVSLPMQSATRSALRDDIRDMAQMY